MIYTKRTTPDERNITSDSLPDGSCSVLGPTLGSSVKKMLDSGAHGRAFHPCSITLGVQCSDHH